MLHYHISFRIIISETELLTSISFSLLRKFLLNDIHIVLLIIYYLNEGFSVYCCRLIYVFFFFFFLVISNTVLISVNFGGNLVINTFNITADGCVFYYRH